MNFNTDFKYISSSSEDTLNFAKKFAATLKKEDVIVLTGELGSGKTKFVEGVLTFFGLENEISSPTFTIVNEYQTPKFPIYHFDVYRLADTSEFYEIGGDEYFDNGVCLIEWGELINEALPKKYIHISFQKSDSDENSRIINVKHINMIKSSQKGEECK